MQFQENRHNSVLLARDPEVLTTLLNFYAWPEACILDVTANSRRMWKGINWPTVTFADIDPIVSPDIVADFCHLPVADASYDIIVFDPPHLPAAAASSKSDKQYIKDYGLAHSPYGDNISSCFIPFLLEACRILRQEGLIFAKLKDYVHNHCYQWTLVDFISAVRNQVGLTPCDLIIKRDPSGGALTSSKWKKAHHGRNVHCWWVVVRKGYCESKLVRNAPDLDLKGII